MAAPVVAGILATRLQGVPSRTVSQLRSILTTLARTDSSVGAAPTSAFGYGKVTIDAINSELRKKANLWSSRGNLPSG